jgi:hypothetical protein
MSVSMPSVLVDVRVHVRVHVHVHVHVNVCKDTQCSVEMDIYLGHGHAPWTRTCSLEMGMQPGYGHAAWTRTCSMRMTYRHATWTCSMDKDIYMDINMEIDTDMDMDIGPANKVNFPTLIF